MKLNECSCGCGGSSNSCMDHNMEENQRYMTIGNLKTIKRLVDIMLEMDPEAVENILNDGHDWAADHIATSKDDIEEVAGFLMNRMQNIGQVKHGHLVQGTPFVHTFESFLNEAVKTKSKKKKIDQDGDGDTDFADAKIAQYTKGGINKKKAIAMSRKFNKK